MDLKQKAKDFTKKNLTQCSQEIVDWRRTGILQDGKVRELAVIVEEMGLDDSTRQAEGLVVQAALEVAAKSDQQLWDVWFDGEGVSGDFEEAREQPDDQEREAL